MANGYGFRPPQAQGTPHPQQVGAMLMQQRQQPMQQQAPDDAALRRQGATLMGGPGQTDIAGSALADGHSEGALRTAIGEALTRMGGGYQANPNPHKPRDRTMQTLQRLGLSSAEAELLMQTGGF